jgi:hypothetical protein
VVLTLRRQKIDPMPRENFDPPAGRSADPISPPRQDDYLVEGEEPSEGWSPATRIINGLQVLLIIVIAVLSLALFWMLGQTFNIL